MEKMTWRERLLNLLFPPKCPFCRQLLTDCSLPVCAVCQRELPWLQGREAERQVEFAKVCWSPLGYQGMVPDAVKRYKFGRVRAYAAPFGLMMAQCVQDHAKKQPDLVTWAPLSRKRLKKRGFDQAELLARKVGERLSLPVCSTLEKTRHTSPQSRIDGDAGRRANALGAYRLKPGQELAGKRVLLVDDVVTSGATLGECARLLTMEGAEVFCLTLAQARRKSDK